MNLFRADCVQLEERGKLKMHEWSFSSSAELVIGAALALVVVALVFV